MIFDKRFLYIKLASTCEFTENRLNDSYTLLTALNEYITLFFYCCTVHFNNTEILITNECTPLLRI